MAEVKKVPVEDYKVVLTLSKQEALSLMTVCGAVGGSNETYRKHTENIYLALRNIFPDFVTIGKHSGVFYAIGEIE